MSEWILGSGLWKKGWETERMRKERGEKEWEGVKKEAWIIWGSHPSSTSTYPRVRKTPPTLQFNCKFASCNYASRIQIYMRENGKENPPPIFWEGKILLLRVTENSFVCFSNCLFRVDHTRQSCLNLRPWVRLFLFRFSHSSRPWCVRSLTR